MSNCLESNCPVSNCPVSNCPGSMAETVPAGVAETGFCQYFGRNGRNGRNTKYDIFKICSLLMNAIDCMLLAVSYLYSLYCYVNPC